MKYLSFFTTCIFLARSVLAQPATQDASSKGTILTKASYIGLDLTKPEVNFAINNLRKPKIKQNNHCVWGLFLQAKNDEGLANVFSEGMPAASGLARVYAGYRWSNALPPANTRTAFINDFQDINEQVIQLDKDLSAALRASLIEFLPKVSDKTARHKLQTDIDTFLDGKNSTFTVLDKLTIVGGDSPELKQAKKDFKLELSPIVSQYTRKLDDLTEQRAKLMSADSKPYWSTILYVFGGVRGTSFKNIGTVNQANLASSFRDTLFRGDEIGFGLNARYAFLEAGLTIASINTSNFKYLDKREYTLRTMQSQSNGSATLISEKKITAYQGAFQRLRATELNADLIGYAPLSEREMMLINLYGRFTTYSDKPEIYPNRTDLGLGVYVHQNDGKFLGGLYIELPDVSGKATTFLEGTAPSRAIRRFQFGLVTRYNLTSLLNW